MGQAGGIMDRQGDRPADHLAHDADRPATRMISDLARVGVLLVIYAALAFVTVLSMRGYGGV